MESGLVLHLPKLKLKDQMNGTIVSMTNGTMSFQAEKATLYLVNEQKDG
jgi:hypothetical protein